MATGRWASTVRCSYDSSDALGSGPVLLGLAADTGTKTTYAASESVLGSGYMIRCRCNARPRTCTYVRYWRGLRLACCSSSSYGSALLQACMSARAR